MQVTKLLLLGGGHCRACIDVIEAEGKLRVVAGIVQPTADGQDAVLVSYAILAAIHQAGIQTRPAWTLLSEDCLHNRDCPCTPLPVAESLARRIINLPSSAGFDVGRVAL